MAGYYGFTLDVHVSVRPSVFCFRMITSKHQWIFTKLGMCSDIAEIWFEIANGQISLMFDTVICPRHDNGGALKLNFFFLAYCSENSLKITIWGLLFFVFFCFFFTEITKINVKF